MSQPIGVLLMAYGSPERPEDVAAYYTHIRGGRPPTPEQLAALQARYARIADRPSLNAITREQAAGVQRALDATEPGRFRVYVGMKHWHPYIADTVAQMERDGIQSAVALVLAPHYSRMSVAVYQKTAREAATQLHFTNIDHWYDEPAFIQLWAERIRTGLAALSAPNPGSPGEPSTAENALVLFSAHSLPERILAQSDPYPDQLRASAAAIARAAGVSHWRFAYQSAGRTPEPWLGPDILEVLSALKTEGYRRILSCPIGFVATHLEVLDDIDFGAQARAKALGLQLVRAAMPDADPAFTGLLAQLTRRCAGR